VNYSDAFVWFRVNSWFLLFRLCPNVLKTDLARTGKLERMLEGGFDLMFQVRGG